MQNDRVSKMPLDLLPAPLVERYRLLATVAGPTLNTEKGKTFWARVGQELDAIEALVKGKEGIVGPVPVDKTPVTYCWVCEETFEDNQLVLKFLPTGQCEHIHCVDPEQGHMEAYQPVIAPIDEVTAAERAIRKMETEINRVRDSLNKMAGFAGLEVGDIAVRLKPTGDQMNQESLMNHFTYQAAKDAYNRLLQLGFTTKAVEEPHDLSQSGRIRVKDGSMQLVIDYTQTSEERHAWRVEKGYVKEGSNNA